MATALRETREELGLELGEGSVWGMLRSLPDRVPGTGRRRGGAGGTGMGTAGSGEEGRGKGDRDRGDTGVPGDMGWSGAR